jgi:DNA polymerase IV
VAIIDFGHSSDVHYKIKMSVGLPFNTKKPTLMHIDLNSCFASVEQQANPKLRGKPIAVAAYTTPSGCIVAPSVEAKEYGVKTGIRVKDGKMLCPNLIVLLPDPWKYRTVHLRLKKLLENYTDLVTPKSIDEFILDLEGYPSYQKGMESVGVEIKQRIKSEIGNWLRVSIGIGTNRFLAKTAAGLKKPDGLERIDNNTFTDVYKKLALTELCGIKVRNAIRLQGLGIHTVWDFYEASLWKL